MQKIIFLSAMIYHINIYRQTDIYIYIYIYIYKITNILFFSEALSMYNQITNENTGNLGT